MEIYQLDPEEKQVLKDFEQEKKRLQEIARNTLNKKRHINIMLSEKDLHKLKVREAEDIFLIRLWLVRFFTALPKSKQAPVSNF